ncbi:YdbL family protein [Arhodomonas sp. SL1]|uniref:YdbL family protein n=1 Tax=Arhodomonas sp. SL1 TaxID=3425691 RepID=UPI003F882E2D
MKSLTLLPLLALVAGCVTINVYFPAVAAERAADRIIQDVWGEDGAPPEGREETPEGEDSTSSAAAPPVALRLLEAVIPAAHAQEPRIDISSPAIKRLTASMEQRHRRLQPHYESGAIGLTRNALIEVRDLGSVPLAQRGEVRQLVAAENDDRNALYREIAVANEHPEWEDQIRDVFAERWIGNARPGWYYQNEAGEWVRK